MLNALADIKKFITQMDQRIINSYAQISNNEQSTLTEFLLKDKIFKQQFQELENWTSSNLTLLRNDILNQIQVSKQEVMDAQAAILSENTKMTVASQKLFFNKAISDKI